MIDAPEGMIDLGLAQRSTADDTQASGGGCACCAAPAQSADGAVPAAASETALVAEYGVEGMTCGNCVNHVTAELGAIDGVDEVRVELVAGGVSKVSVVSERPIDTRLIADAVDEAGYALAR